MYVHNHAYGKYEEYARSKKEYNIRGVTLIIVSPHFENVPARAT